MERRMGRGMERGERVVRVWAHAVCVRGTMQLRRFGAEKLVL
jgi:hypothetical protein